MHFFPQRIVLVMVPLFMTVTLVAVPDKEISLTRDLVFPDGSRYCGQVKNGLRNGTGRFVWPDGAEFQGEFVDGEPNGRGIYWYTDGRRKAVVYDHGVMIESHFMVHEPPAAGCVFGEFSFNGTYRGWYRGSRTKGYQPHGRGIMKYDNGSVYTGQWSDGKMNGNGKIAWEDGSSYSGQWIMGKRTGYGTYTWPNGDTYVGQWKENNVCGNGVYRHHDGKIEKGKWRENTVNINM